MKVIVPELSGFCPGVKIAEKKIFGARDAGKKLKILGKLIHNASYIRHLLDAGIATINSADEASPGDTIVVRTHGMNRAEEGRLAEKFDILDLTCFKVKALQKKIFEYSRKGFFVIITGKKNHPEVEGLVSYAENFVVLEDEDCVRSFCAQACSGSSAYAPMPEKIFLCSQTTSSRSLFDFAVKEVSSCCNSEIAIHNSICSITDEREKRSLELLSETDVTIVLGDRESSNATKLYKLLKNNCGKTYFVNNLAELLQARIDFTGMKSVQVVSSSSTPDFVQNEVIKYLENI